jgi:hypothetical protein
VKLGKYTTETLEMLHEAFREHSLSQTAFMFRVSFQDEERSGRPSTSKTTENVEKI